MALCSLPVLKLPDFIKPFVIEPNAPEQTVGAILLQYYDNMLHKVVHFCKKYICTKRIYALLGKVLLAISKLTNSGGAT